MNLVNLVVINKERDGAINPKVTDQDGNNADGRHDQRAP
jgi:hypothetical protein